MSNCSNDGDDAPTAAVGSTSPLLRSSGFRVRKPVPTAQPDPTFSMEQVMSLVTSITKQATSSTVAAALSATPAPSRDRGNLYLPPFDPDVRSHDIRDWCANVDQTIATIGISQHGARIKAILQLKGRAKTWADTWCQDLIQTFGEEFRYADDVHRWRDYTSEQASSYAEYATTGGTLFKRVRPEATDADALITVIVVISTALTLCSAAVTVGGRWPNPDKDPLVYIANPIEANMPGHWVPVSIVKAILEKGPPTPDNTPEPSSTKKRVTKRIKGKQSCMPFMTGFYKGCNEEDGYDINLYWTGTFPPGFSPEYPPGYFTSTEPYIVDADGEHENKNSMPLLAITKENYSGGGNSEQNSSGSDDDNKPNTDENEENGDGGDKGGNDGSDDDQDKEKDRNDGGTQEPTKSSVSEEPETTTPTRTKKRTRPPPRDAKHVNVAS